jgi:RNA polymerase sigma factor (TIGR02999 family)
MPESSNPATVALQMLAAGDQRAADALFPLIYSELRKLAAAKLANERADHTLQPTALVHEAYLKLIDQTRVEWKNSQHFFAVASEAIRRILVDSARAKNSIKRGRDRQRIDLESVGASEPDSLVDFEQLDAALTELAALSERQARVVVLRYFGGLEVPVVASMLGVSERTVVGDWRVARVWLQQRLDNVRVG